jgi:hypothetical protein
LTRAWTSREAHAPETGALVGQLLLGHKDQLEKLFVSGLGAMDVLLKAQTILYADGKPAGLAPDQRTRLKIIGGIQTSPFISQMQTFCETDRVPGFPF